MTKNGKSQTNFLSNLKSTAKSSLVTLFALVIHTSQTVGMGFSGLCNTAIGQAERDRQNRTDRQDRQNWTGRTGQQEQKIHNWRGRTGQ
jgi:hypothetical protein